ncbi:capsular associated protein [Metarhizium album ARSEF 1941]|uniref:Capsular associated protein n=1 Tax=Metarhizium album (strain ARSEF 1941) TaxID=1081103 RepID=A0A0B2WNT7_METAS|nr:capsular associated protein [Metarhizium album ARSEF 1941]KHN97711.1 capsular associated protein [Metarhizium album ARSEF 1941]
MALLLIVATGFTFIYPLEHFEKRHPINDLIYEARIIHDRWLLKASTSKKLATAVTVYSERHGGRLPPPHFGDWYRYASGSSIVDEFRQIDSDLDVFWSLSPEIVRKRVQLALSNPGVGNITVENGHVTVSDAGHESMSMDLRELADTIKKFSRHLPDMILPVNLNPTPRVLPLWKDTQYQSRGYLNSMAKTLSERSESHFSAANKTIGLRPRERTAQSTTSPQTQARRYRQMQTEACPATSRAQTSPYWDTGLFCSACVKDHSRGQLMSEWGKLLDVCSQPDLNHLYSFSVPDLSAAPIRELVPLFGPSKMGGFQDILIPLSSSRQDRTDDGEPFLKRKDTLLWRSAIGGEMINEQAVRGSHKLRLLHLINKADAKDRTTMILPVPGADNQFRSVFVSVPEANRDLSFNVGIDDFSACIGQHCDVIKTFYGEVTQTEDPFQYRYVLLTDEDDGPPAKTLNMLRSHSLPFISTIFKTWYSERLTPWLHFVPVDPRYQALHTTLLYFTGTATKAKMNGINTYLTGRSSDGEWIARQGQRWASEAIGAKDREIYLFRLLLEWARLIDDRRGEIGYRRESNGEFRSDEWSRTS